MIIAIDGPAGAGKSTVSKRVASALNFKCLDTGAMYRAITWKTLNLGADVNNETEVLKMAKSSKISFEFANGYGGFQKVLLDEKDVSQEIRSPRVTGYVSVVAAMPSVRKVLVELQKKLIKNQDYVLEGRDTATVVCPDAELRIFLTASPRERAKRRFLEFKEKGIDVDLNSIERDIIRRDHLDSSRKASPLIKAPGAMLLDTTDLTIQQVVDEIVRLVEKVKGVSE